MRKYPFLILTVGLLLFLVAPFILKLKDPRLEMYPAVIFPSGAGKVQIDQDKHQISSMELYGYKNEPVKIDKKKFLKNIPDQYLYTIREGNFGLEEYFDEFKLYKPPIKFTIQNNVAPKTLAETKAWIKARLREQQLADSAFMIRQYRITYNTRTKMIVSKEKIDEKIFKLD
ncbi:MAG: hypothetical protein WD555_04055 [Fulvivirga sp.]